MVANVGDSRAVLATTSEDGSLVPVQLTVDFKPNLPCLYLSLALSHTHTHSVSLQHKKKKKS